jgi:mono/diheme cytochrome c family protein
MTAFFRSFSTRVVCLISAWAIALVSAPGIVHGQDAQKSVNEGVYSEAQAARGQQKFEGTCTACHDTARFTGPEFIKNWTGQPLHALFDTVSSTMPEDNPGSLEPQQYGDVIAYFLKLNGYPAGPNELKGDAAAMKAIKMEARK